jgi:hypothetical protein
MTLCVSLVAVPGLAAQQAHEAKPTAKGTDALAKIRQVMSAAPDDIGKNAAIVEMDQNGQMKQLRAGTNGWTCMPSRRGTAGAEAPMCLDKPWMDWVDAWMHKTPPHTSTMGIAYMLRGDMGANGAPQVRAPEAVIRRPPAFVRNLLAPVSGSTGQEITDLAVS